jgi:microcystin-dependent protein
MSFSMKSSTISQSARYDILPYFNASLIYNVPVDPNLSSTIQPNDTLVFNGTNFQIEAEPSVPAGSIFPYAGITAPSFYLLCDGSAVSRTTYSKLFSVLGTVYGIGDGSTTFNLPNLQGNIPVGKNSGTFNTLGATGGTETVTLTIDQMPAHDHGGNTTAGGDHNHSGETAEAGEHFHTVSNSVQKTGVNTPSGLDNSPNEIDNIQLTNINTSAAGVHKHDISDSGTHTHGINSQGGGQAHNNLQPYLVVNYIIKT